MTPSPLIVITGATNGLGRIAAGDLARQGARLAITARSEAKADETRAEILAKTPGAEIDVFLGDFTRIADTRRVAAEIATRYDRIDVLVNNAGIHAFQSRVTPDGLPEMIVVNYLTPFILTDALLPQLRRAPAGRIVTVASTAGLEGAKYTAAYTASKHAAVEAERAVAAEVAGFGVTANAICPGYVRSDMTNATIENIEAKTGRDGEAALAKLSPLGRLLEPEEVAFAVAFLAAPEAGAINGQTLILDGGGIQT